VLLHLLTILQLLQSWATIFRNRDRRPAHIKGSGL
jgi:hypothetical protein